MSEAVKEVTDAVGVIKEVSDLAKDAKQNLLTAAEEVRQSLGMVNDVASALRGAGAELRGALGVQTNNPPANATNKTD